MTARTCADCQLEIHDDSRRDCPRCGHDLSIDQPADGDYLVNDLAPSAQAPASRPPQAGAARSGGTERFLVTVLLAAGVWFALLLLAGVVALLLELAILGETLDPERRTYWQPALLVLALLAFAAVHRWRSTTGDAAAGSALRERFPIRVLAAVVVVGLVGLGTAIAVVGPGDAGDSRSAPADVDQASEPAEEDDVPPAAEEESDPCDEPEVLCAAEFGDRWPLTVDQVTASCQPNSGDYEAVYVTTSDGTTYPANGTARQEMFGGGSDRNPIEKIWAIDTETTASVREFTPDAPAARKGIGPVIEAARELC